MLKQTLSVYNCYNKNVWLGIDTISKLISFSFRKSFSVLYENQINYNKKNWNKLNLSAKNLETLFQVVNSTTNVPNVYRYM